MSFQLLNGFTLWLFFFFCDKMSAFLKSLAKRPGAQSQGSGASDPSRHCSSIYTLVASDPCRAHRDMNASVLEANLPWQHVTSRLRVLAAQVPINTLAGLLLEKLTTAPTQAQDNLDWTCQPWIKVPEMVPSLRAPRYLNSILAVVLGWTCISDHLLQGWTHVA